MSVCNPMGYDRYRPTCVVCRYQQIGTGEGRGGKSSQKGCGFSKYPHPT